MWCALCASKRKPEDLLTQPVAVHADPINPAHYREHPSGIDCIQITKHENFCIGNAIKYLWRHDKKAEPIQDLKKAIWYIEKEIDRIQNYQLKPEPTLREAADAHKKFDPQDSGPCQPGIDKR